MKGRFQEGAIGESDKSTKRSIGSFGSLPYLRLSLLCGSGYNKSNYPSSHDKVEK